MRQPVLTRRAGLCAALVACLLPGCGGDEETSAVSSGASTGEGGALLWAVADPINAIDPLQADTRSEQILARQINEPLTARPRAPFDPERRVPGLAIRAEGSAGDSIWTLTLRDGVVFQDGTPFNDAAVRANATRWLTTAEGRGALPDLVSVDSPSPGQVRFVLAAPDPTFPKRLAAPQLGIVSPAALAPASGEGAVLGRPFPAGSGTGAFELRERDSREVLLARNTAWWGAAAKVELGPALDQVELTVSEESSLRLAILDAGEAELADELDPGDAEQARSDPLLSILPSTGATSLGLERSVRGVTSGLEIPALSGVWLTQLGEAG
jgi:peptide/nickel transport system substrate-binding protein